MLIRLIASVYNHLLRLLTQDYNDRYNCIVIAHNVRAEIVKGLELNILLTKLKNT